MAEDYHDIPASVWMAQVLPLVAEGSHVHMKFTCAYCGNRLTIEESNVFYVQATCDKCGQITTNEKGGYLLEGGTGANKFCIFQMPIQSPRIAYPKEPWKGMERLSCDCGTKQGSPHQWNCAFETCPHCKKPLNLTNPSGFCSHVRWPEACAVCRGE